MQLSDLRFSRIENSESGGLAVVREARAFASRGNGAGGIIPVFAHLGDRPRMSRRTRHAQSSGLRLLRRGAPRNDMRGRGRGNTVRLGAVRPAEYAKQSQFPAGGIGGKECREKRLGERDAIWDAAKTKPILKCQVPSLKFQVSSRRSPASMPPTPNFTLQTSHFWEKRLTASLQTRKTKPICRGPGWC